MKIIQNKQGDIVVIKRGEELHTCLQQYALDNELRGAWVQGIGGSGSVTLGHYSFERKEYEWQEFGDSLEIASLTGNLAIVDGEPFWHIHGSFGQRDFGTVSGHVKKLVVGLTCELLIAPFNTPLVRSFDDETGLNLIS